ncbi:MAG: mannitol dehydrogenase family protein [Streptomycetaceae bacterium]|nr:MAG: mannitol dehydrogenase family protein [Streptomycetaceae bacterium]
MNNQNVQLSDLTLEIISSKVKVPSYDRTRMKNYIVHIGVGHFVRAHLAMYLDQLLESDPNCDWGIWGIGLHAFPGETLEALKSQDCLYTLTEKNSDSNFESRVIGSIKEVESGDVDGQSLIEIIGSSSTKIVSLTITEGGYGIDAVTGQFSGQKDELILADMQDPQSSKSWLGILVEGIKVRISLDSGPLTLMTCDNIPHNGDVAKSSLKSFVKIVAPEILGWVEKNMTFPNSMVDRVTPGTTEDDRVYIRETFGYSDAWPVACEPYALWVLEDNFASGRPAFENVGVKIVEDVLPYELMKLRIANGTHQALCYFGSLLGHTYVHEAIHDPDIRTLLVNYIDDEAVPTLAKIPGIDLNEWGQIVIERFGNPQIKDKLTRICAETSDRIPKFVLPVVKDQLAAGRSAKICAAVLASWARYVLGTDENGQALEVVDPKSTSIIKSAKLDVKNFGTFLDQSEIFGTLGQNSSFRRDYIEARQKIDSSGVRKFLLEMFNS